MKQIKQIIINVIVTVVTCIVIAYFTIEHIEKIEVTYVDEKITSTVESDLEVLYEEVVDGVVYIHAYSSYSQGSGSGFIYKIEEGYAYILTNQHVVEDARTLAITTNDGVYLENVEYLGGDSFYDVAVLKVEATDDMKVLEMKEDDDYDVGEYVLAIGSPLGEDFINTATLGIVSGKDRYVVVDEDNAVGLKLIQTDAAINPGNSGGPLFSIDGEVIGINSLKFNSYNVEGMGFSIPIEGVLNKLEYFENGESVRPSLGARIAQAQEGLVIIDTLQDSASYNAGMQQGDIIIAIEGVEVNTLDEVRKELYEYIGGDVIVITVNRDGEEIEIEVTLDSY